MDKKYVDIDTGNLRQFSLVIKTSDVGKYVLPWSVEGNCKLGETFCKGMRESNTISTYSISFESTNI